jgi:hypothetical protein
LSEVWVTALVIQPGIIETSCVRWPSGKDFGCGFHLALSLGTRSITRRVVFISSSNSGRIVSAILIGLSE